MKYHDIDSINCKRTALGNYISVFHMNVRMLSKHHAELTVYLNTFKQTFDVIVLSEISKEGCRYLNHIFPDYVYIFTMFQTMINMEE